MYCIIQICMTVHQSFQQVLQNLIESAQNIPDAVWLVIITKIRDVLGDRWFGQDKEEQEELNKIIKAINNGNHERAGNLIQERDNTEQIEKTIHDMCRSVLDCEPQTEEEAQKTLNTYN